MKYPHSNLKSPEEIENFIVKPPFIRSAINYGMAFLGDNFKTTAILLYAVLALSAWKYISAAPQLADPASRECVLAIGTETLERPLAGTLRFSPILFFWYSRKIWSAFLLMGVVPALIVKYVFKERLSDYGLVPKSLSRTIKSFLLFLPIFVVIGWTSGATTEFYNIYPYNPLAGASWACLLTHSVLYFFLYYLAWEFMFRGFIQLGLASSFGPIAAILIQVLASTMLHYGHPASETFGCVAGGLLWGYLVFRTGSIWSGWWQHALLGVMLDWSLVINAR